MGELTVARAGMRACPCSFSQDDHAARKGAEEPRSGRYYCSVDHQLIPAVATEGDANHFRQLTKGLGIAGNALRMDDSGVPLTALDVPGGYAERPGTTEDIRAGAAWGEGAQRARFARPLIAHLGYQTLCGAEAVRGGCEASCERGRGA